MNEIISILIANLALLAAGALLFFNSWFDYIRPDLFYIFNIYENNFFNFKEHKFFLPFSGKKNKYVIDGAEYDNTGFRPIINPKGVYVWNFKEKNNIPSLFAEQVANIDAKAIVDSRKKNYYNMLVAGEASIEDFLKTWGIVILAIVILAFLGYVISSNQQTQAILINITQQR